MKPGKHPNDDPVLNFCVLARNTTPLYQAPVGMIHLDKPEEVDDLVAKNLKHRWGDLGELHGDICTDRAKDLTAVNGKYMVTFPLDVPGDGKSARYSVAKDRNPCDLVKFYRSLLQLSDKT